MNHYVRLLVGTLVLSASTLTTAYSQTTKPLGQAAARVPQVFQHRQPTSSLVEEFSFLIKDFKVEHQSENNNVNISVSFRYVPNVSNADYPDYRLIAKDVETFLTSYPNEQDYWEIVNKKLTALLLKKYPPIQSITCELTVDPVTASPYTRSSRVTRVRAPTRK